MSDAATVNDDLDQSATDDDEEAQELLASADDGVGADQSDGEKDWQAEFEAQRRINRDLERKNKRSFNEVRRELERKYQADLAEALKAKSGDGTDDMPDLDAIRQQARDEARAESLRDKALDKLEAKAARSFQNPEDARAFLASRVDEFIDDGKVDVDAITDALDGLLSDRPYLGVTQGDTKRFQGTGDGGPRGSAGKPQLSRQDVERLAKEGKHAEIDAARQNGQLNDLLGIT